MFVFWAPCGSWQGTGGWGDVWGHGECPYTCAHTHAHVYKLQMAANMEASMFNMHVGVCMHVCVCSWSTSQIPTPTSNPIHPHKANDIPMYGYMIINFKKCTDSDLVIYSFKNCTGANLYRKVKEKAIVLTCDILHNVLRWGIVQCVTISSSSHPVFCHLFFFGCPHTLLEIYSQPGGKLLNVSLIEKLSSSSMGWLSIYSQKCMWEGMGRATLTVPHKGSNCHVMLFSCSILSQNTFPSNMFVDKMLINLLKRVASLDSYGIQGRKGHFGCPHTVLGRYYPPGPELINEWSLFLLSMSGMGVVGYIFLTLYLGGWVGGLLMTGTPEGL